MLSILRVVSPKGRTRLFPYGPAGSHTAEVADNCCCPDLPRPLPRRSNAQASIRFDAIQRCPPALPVPSGFDADQGLFRGNASRLCEQTWLLDKLYKNTVYPAAPPTLLVVFNREIDMNGVIWKHDRAPCGAFQQPSIQKRTHVILHGLHTTPDPLRDFLV